MYAGAAHADMSEYRECIKLWNYALSLKIMKETILSSDTSFTVRAVIQLYMNILLREQNREEIQFEDVLTTTRSAFVSHPYQHFDSFLAGILTGDLSTQSAC